VAERHRTTASYVATETGQMLLRTAGESMTGVPLVVVHDIPGSSALIDPLLSILGRYRRVLAFDMTGQGESVPPDGWSPTVGGWASAVLGALDRLGVRRVALYGHGTGGTVAAEIARLAPDRVTAVLLGAPPALPEAGRDAFAAAYAPSAEPEWDGGHLPRVWHHLRDQELWWPWHERTRAAARPGELDIDPDRLTARARECLKHPALYRPAWREVLTYALPALDCPVTVLAAERDLFARFAEAAATAVGGPVVPVAGDWQSRADAILARLPPD
jgi:pimeloyl-ACP methyl ester carboxylesterase